MFQVFENFPHLVWFQFLHFSHSIPFDLYLTFLLKLVQKLYERGFFLAAGCTYAGKPQFMANSFAMSLILFNFATSEVPIFHP